MKKYFFRIFVLLFAGCIGLFASEKPRLIVTTDIGGDPDDSQSMVRLLMYSNEFEIEGLIASASGTPGELTEAITRQDMIEERIRAYGQVRNMLIKHDPEYPTMQTLLERTKTGNKNRGLEYIGQGHGTEGSEWIIRVVDKEDERPVHISIWGGQTDLAQALWQVKHNRSKVEYDRFVEKIRVYDIADQDGIVEYIWQEHPALFYILNKAPEGVDKRESVFRGMYLGGDISTTSQAWLEENVTQNHGPLGALYPDHGLWTAPNPYKAMKEGDTPSWFYLLQNGLNDPEHPEWGGWGGRFNVLQNNIYSDAKDNVDSVVSERASLWRWRPDFQNDFAARMDWCVGDFSQCNHNPIVDVNGVGKSEILIINARPGERLALNAENSSDPDGNRLTYNWWQYKEAGTFMSEIRIDDPNSNNISVEIPSDIGDQSIHIICEVMDDGIPSLKNYKRIVIHRK